MLILFSRTPALNGGQVQARLLLFLVLIGATILTSSYLPHSASIFPHIQLSPNNAYGRLPLTFEANAG